VIYIRDGRRYYGNEPSHNRAQPVEVPPVSHLGYLMTGTLAQRAARREQEAEQQREKTAEREVSEIREARERRENRLRYYQEAAGQRRQQRSQVEEVPPPGPRLALAIVNAGRKARGEPELEE
jgi:hypothetical protein